MEDQLKLKPKTELELKAEKVIEEFIDLTLIAIDEQKKRPFKDACSVHQLKSSVMAIHAMLLNRGDRQ